MNGWLKRWMDGWMKSGGAVKAVEIDGKLNQALEAEEAACIEGKLRR